jgi:hypothetical protein
MILALQPVIGNCSESQRYPAPVPWQTSKILNVDEKCLTAHLLTETAIIPYKVVKVLKNYHSPY